MSIRLELSSGTTERTTSYAGGKEKVSTEIALSFLAYNLRHAINLLGVGALVAHFSARNQKNRG